MTRRKENPLAPEQDPHPLEGRYIVFKYYEDEEDYFEEYMAVYRFENRRLISMVGPQNFGSGFPEELDDRTIAILKKLGITEVVTVHFSGEDFFGIPSGKVMTQYPEEWDDDILESVDTDFIEVNSLNFEPIYDDPDDIYRKLLNDNGISIVHYHRQESGDLTLTP